MVKETYRPLILPAFAVAAIFGAEPVRAACTFGTPFGGEPSLQQSFNNLLSPAPNVVTDCLSDGSGPTGDAHWTSVGQTSATILLEIAGFANVNTFGLYDLANSNNRLLVFSGPSGPGTTAQLSFASVATGQSVTVTVGGVTRTTEAPFSGTAFGFYLVSGSGAVFFSDSRLNPGGVDRMYAYRGNGATFISGPASGSVFGPVDAILAYEDLLSGDNDFQDFVVLVRGVQPIPLPGAAWLLGSALVAAGLPGALRRRRAASSPRPA